MAAGHMTDGIVHRHHTQPKREWHADQPGADLRKSDGDRGHAAPANASHNVPIASAVYLFAFMVLSLDEPSTTHAQDIAYTRHGCL